jgi:hypothetical protein
MSLSDRIEHEDLLLGDADGAAYWQFNVIGKYPTTGFYSRLQITRSTASNTPWVRRKAGSWYFSGRSEGILGVFLIDMLDD